MRSVLAEMVILLLAVSGLAHADADVPTAPPDLKDAQTLALQRLSVDDLKAYIPGTIVRVGAAGKQYKMIFKSNGTVWKLADNGRRERGYWRFDARREVFCEAIREKQGREGGCFAVFASNNTPHFFDYSIHTGHYAHTWWKAPAN